MMALRLLRSDAGVTLIELVVTLTILSVLAMGIMPLSVVSSKRAKEFELKRNLRTIRTALDAYKERVDNGEIPKEAFSSGYPKPSIFWWKEWRFRDRCRTRSNSSGACPKTP